MPEPRARLAHNVPGPFYVDASCIDCDTCRWMAPEVYTRREEQASVHHQPATEAERRRALMALLSCPTASIATDDPRGMDEAVAALPDPVAGGVFHCGYHSEKSFGAASYLIVREKGNVLVDSPRLSGPLMKRIEAMGGVDTLFLTHTDDVAEHRRLHERFGCRRILHSRDVGPQTEDVEVKLEGTRPVALDDEIVLIPVPGHTEGSTCLLYRDTFLFTGDHLAWSERLGQIIGFRDACWYDWTELVASTERLQAFAFEWILPGHGRRCRFPRPKMRDELRRTLAWMKSPH